MQDKIAATLPRKAVKAVMEKKIAILEKAIEARRDSVELRMALLQTVGDVWDADKVSHNAPSCAWG